MVSMGNFKEKPKFIKTYEFNGFANESLLSLKHNPLLINETEKHIIELSIEYLSSLSVFKKHSGKNSYFKRYEFDPYIIDVIKGVYGSNMFRSEAELVSQAIILFNEKVEHGDVEDFYRDYNIK